MTDEEVVKAKKIIKDLHSYCFLTQPTYRKMGYSFNEGDFECLNELIDEINHQRAEIERLQKENEEANKLVLYGKMELEKGMNTLVEAKKLHRLDLERAKIQIRHECEKLKHSSYQKIYYPARCSGKTDRIVRALNNLEAVKSETIKEFADKITEVFERYKHLHHHADKARRDTIETFDLTEIEMQSVWDVMTLEKNGMAEYEEMGRLQKNIETIAQDRLLTELENDFKLLVKEMAGDTLNDKRKIEIDT